MEYKGKNESLANAVDMEHYSNNNVQGYHTMSRQWDSAPSQENLQTLPSKLSNGNESNCHDDEKP